MEHSFYLVNDFLDYCGMLWEIECIDRYTIYSDIVYVSIILCKL
jgi:hypothetical protein